MKASISALLCCSFCSADWPQFRGVNGSGVSLTAKPPVDFSPAKNVAWKTPLPPGHSSPVIAGDRMFVTAADDAGKLLTICLDRHTGKILWQKEAPRPRQESFQKTNSAASPSPVTDGKDVFVFFGDFGLIAYTLEGNERWKLPLGPFNNPNGHGSSPILFEKSVILLCDQDTNSFLIAIDKATGRVQWKTERPDVTRSYTTPAVYNNAELIVPGSYQLASYDARSGKRLWTIGGLSWQPKSTPLVSGDTVYAHWWENGGESEQASDTPSYAETLASFDKDKDSKISMEEFAPDPRLQKGFPSNDLDRDGFVDERDWSFYIARRASRNALLAVKPATQEVVWRMQKFLPNVPSPLLYRNVMYLIKDGGILTSVDAKTGKILKQGRLPGALDTYYASPVAADGHLYLISQTGKMTVLKAGPEWEVVSSIDFDDPAFATPALIDRSIYVRTRSAMYCFQKP